MASSPESNWLDQAPRPCIARIVDEYEDVLNLAITARIYDSETLVVIPVRLLGDVAFRERGRNG
jgi:hypothetical protein